MFFIKEKKNYLGRKKTKNNNNKLTETDNIFAYFDRE